MGQADKQKCCGDDSRPHTHIPVRLSYWRGGNVARQRVPIVIFPLGNETANWRWDLLSSTEFCDGFG